MAWAPDYVTADELKSFIRVDDVLDDVEIALAITAASRCVDGTCNRQFGKVASAEARYYTSRWDRERCRWVVEVDDIMDITGLEVHYDSADDGTFTTELETVTLLPRNAVVKGKPYTSIQLSSTANVVGREDAIRVSAVFGWTEVPDAIKQATLLQASRLLARRDAPFGVAGSPESGSEVRLLARLDPDVAVIVARYIRWWGAV